ncbi:MAG: hypothetical protein JXB62_02940 [Pirellulales bacterium]|nr:hypothetical protein [Pirellulales bacterium]
MSDRGEPTNQTEKPGAGITGRQAYNIASDTVTGANLRLKDNLFQAIAIFVCLFLGALVGAAVAEQRWAGALVGGLFGLLVGLFGSGIFLMVYRAVMHIRGRHD